MRSRNGAVSPIGSTPTDSRPASMGLAIPRTVITNEPEAVRELVRQCPEGIITKPLSPFAVQAEFLQARANGEISYGDAAYKTPYAISNTSHVDVHAETKKSQGQGSVSLDEAM